MFERQLVVMMALGLLAACGGGGGSGGSAPAGDIGQGGFVPSSAASVIAEGGSRNSNDTVRLSSTGTISVIRGGTTSAVSANVRRVGAVEAFDSTDGRGVVISSPGTISVSGGSGAESLEHTRFGIWVEGDSTKVLAQSSNGVESVSSFVIGNPTPASDMPTAGSATYRGKAVAIELRSGTVPRAMSGSLTATADFADNQLHASAKLRAADGGPGLDVAMPKLAIGGNGFSGDATGGGLTGSVKGGFAGPRAAELGGVFELDGDARFFGAFAGKSER